MATVPIAIERDEIPVGGSVSGTLEESDGTANLQFQAKQGQKYLIEVTWEGMPSVLLSISDPPDPFVDAIDSYFPDSSPFVLRWTAWESGTFHVVVSAAEGAGSYNISVSTDTRPSAPTSVSTAWEGSTVEVSWDPVEGAEYYKVYHDDFFEYCCGLRADGSPGFCNELAADVTGTTYVHADPTRSDRGATTGWSPAIAKDART